MCKDNLWGESYHNEISQNFFFTRKFSQPYLTALNWSAKYGGLGYQITLNHIVWNIFRRKCNICIIKLCSKLIYSLLLFLKTFHITNIGVKWYHSKAKKGIIKESVYVNQIHFKVMCKNKLLLMEIVLFLELNVPIIH